MKKGFYAEGERKTYGQGEWYCTGCLGDGTRVVGFLARYWLVVRLKAALDPNPRKIQMTRLEIQWSQPYSN